VGVFSGIDIVPPEMFDLESGMTCAAPGGGVVFSGTYPEITLIEKTMRKWYGTLFSCDRLRRHEWSSGRGSMPAGSLLHRRRLLRAVRSQSERHWDARLLGHDPLVLRPSRVAPEELRHLHRRHLQLRRGDVLAGPATYAGALSVR
jgi:hypothetical protein